MAYQIILSNNEKLFVTASGYSIIGKTSVKYFVFYDNSSKVSDFDFKELADLSIFVAVIPVTSVISISIKDN